MPLLDQDLPARAQQGDENALAALIARMMPAIRKGAAECTAPGLDFDDAVQEGLIGLFHAVRGFDPAAGQTFTAYAAACIRHAQQDARRAALRKKHAPLNYSVPLPAAEESTDTRPGPEELATYRNNAEDRKYDVIFVNGDSNLENLRGKSEGWTVRMTETEFKNRMFEEA